MNRIIAHLIVLVSLSACFKKENNNALIVDYDMQKIVNKDANFIIYNPNAYSGSYVSFADSTSQYSSGINSNMKLLFKGDKVKKLNISAFIKTEDLESKASIVFKILDKDGTSLFYQEIYVNNTSVPKINEWTNVIGSFNIPNDQKIYNLENSVYVFLYSTKNRVYIDNLTLYNEI